MYNPGLEAEKYINSLVINENPLFFILIEPGQGYLFKPIKNKFPQAKIISLHAKDHPSYTELEPDAFWYPDAGIPIIEFLEKEIPECEAKNIQLIEWRPALSMYGRDYLLLIEASTSFIKKNDANFRTIKAFGQRWYKNFMKNLNIVQNIIHHEVISIPILVTGAGPGLENSFPIINQHRDNIFILASSSSCPALYARNIKPDMIISTDGGNWANYHLFESYRNSCNLNLAVSLTGIFPSQLNNSPVLILSDRSLWQTLILEELRIPHIKLTQRGTVTASALDLAFFLGRSNVYIAGMDLDNNDIRSHAKPYGLDFYLENREKRLNPVYSQVYKRSGNLRDGGSYKIYASWFKNQLSSYPGKLFPLGNNNPLFGELSLLSLEGNNSINKNKFATERINTVNLQERAVNILQKRIKDKSLSKILISELIYLLFPGENNINSDDLIRAINKAA